MTQPGATAEELAALAKNMTALTVWITPCNDEVRAGLKHPTAGGFNPEGATSWPLDVFTEDYLRQGLIKLAETPVVNPQR